MAATEDDIRQAYVKAFNNERLAFELTIILERGQKAAWRQTVLREASGRIIDMTDQLRGIKAALQEYEQALTERKHGGVEGGKFIDKIRALLLDTSTRE